MKKAPYVYSLFFIITMIPYHFEQTFGENVRKDNPIPEIRIVDVHANSPRKIDAKTDDEIDKKLTDSKFFVSDEMIESFEQKLVKNLKKSCNVPEKVATDLYVLANPNNEPLNSSHNLFNTVIPLFKVYPLLQEKIPYISLAELPTPIHACSVLSQQLPVKKLYIKRDDLTGKKLSNGTTLFGGNKVRKLEFWLADALAHNVRTVITFGCVGSNHALATAVYCKFLGLKCEIMLKPQWNSHIVRRNLLLDFDAEATIDVSPTNSLRSIATINKFFKHKQKYGTYPYIIPTGGSSPLGILGYINAVFELKEQIETGLMPEPDRIYVPLGSAGTVVGILLGIKAAKLSSKLVAITVEPEEELAPFVETIKTLVHETVAMLQNVDATFPDIQYTKNDLAILYDFCGTDYALFTQEAVDAIKLVKETENITLDGVYSGKALSGLLYDVLHNDCKNETILFWNTFCSENFTDTVSLIDYKNLPEFVHTYFEEDVQDLDHV